MQSFGNSSKHLDMFSGEHSYDAEFSDPTGDRTKVRELGGLLAFKGGVRDQEHFLKYAKAASGDGKRDQIGYYFIWSPPNVMQSLLQGLSDEELENELQRWSEEFDSMLSTKFNDPPRAIALHTDKVRLHFEAICLKYDAKGRKNHLFDYCNPGSEDLVAQAALAAQMGNSNPAKTIWTAEAVYNLTNWGMERLRDRYLRYEAQIWRNPTESDRLAAEQMDRLSIVAEYRRFLDIATTDESFTKSSKAQVSVKEELGKSLGKRISLPNQFELASPPNFIALARARAERILDRRKIEEQKDLLKSRARERASSRKYSQERNKWLKRLPPDERNQHLFREGDALDARIKEDLKRGREMPSIIDQMLKFHDPAQGEIAGPNRSNELQIHGAGNDNLPELKEKIGKSLPRRDMEDL